MNGLPVEIVSSRDGQYIAENHAVLNGTQTTWVSTVFGPNGSAVAHVNGAIDAFSWDGSLAVSDPGGGAGPLEVVRWRDGGILWSGPSGAGFGLNGALAEPDATRMAICILNPAYPQQSSNPQLAGNPPCDLFVVGADGKLVVQLNHIYW